MDSILFKGGGYRVVSQIEEKVMKEEIIPLQNLPR
jgi:hypothetical protein